MEKLNINQWAEEDRPREKMMALGAQALSDAELLAILVGSGSPQEDAVSLMKRILNDCNNNLNTLGKMTLHQLCDYNGVGPAKAITILAACELGKRRQMERAEARTSDTNKIDHDSLTILSITVLLFGVEQSKSSQNIEIFSKKAMPFPSSRIFRTFFSKGLLCYLPGILFFLV